MYADMLTAALEGARNTQLLMLCNMSFDGFKAAELRLTECGMMQRHDSVVFTTAKGRKFLEAYAALSDITGQYGRIAPLGHKKERLVS
jgi:predicted transcriptional regulator